ncbi:SGNH/GDSL hydrolase family protein [Amycolatopsis sp. DG1A-15b]|uniref:SGNH/GDSL hydrolase family protein n=1 Tax=Amycolatopsis sp. DG1A-15b TaxID=3052846 RepID=UPI00255B9EB9|nr:SGNH/GDSL hydrolase family protein [Amycolatopsis sp. DG1A-15b]WIX86355.1 SGNH/GDSL hydrolase family protein [Amycolatopsis sp. DG1A-15b]
MHKSPRWQPLAAAVSLLSALAAGQSTASAAPAPPPADPPSTSSVPPAQRAGVLGSGWAASADRAVTTVGDTAGLHVLVADAKDGYAWRTAATLTEPGAETSQWIGQDCVTGSGRFAAVVYAPREAVNREERFHAGGLAAVVDLTSGAVRKLPFTVNLAYYNPGCGAGDQVVFTSNLTAGNTYKSRLVTLDAPTAKVLRQVDATGQVTSAVPFGDGVLAAAVDGLAAVGPDGKLRRVADTADTPFRLSADKDGGVGYEVRTKAGTELHRYTPAGDTKITVAPLDSVRLSQVAGHVVVQGPAAARLATPLPAGWQAADVPAGASLSTTGALAVLSASNLDGAPDHPGDASPVKIEAKVLKTGAQPKFSVHPDALVPSAGRAASPAIGAPAAAGQSAAAVDPSTTTTDPDRACAVPRNDPKIQSLQATPEMGEWAADLAVKGQLNVQRPAGWNGSTLPAYTPQGLFPLHALTGGGQVPAQVLLGVMAQESNMWQAGMNTVDGESGNFNQGGFYGRGVGVDSVNFGNVDCGYGATQVTTGMRVSEGTSVYTPTQQVALTVDYAANIAAGLNILIDKWNQMKQVGITVNNGDPAKIENWWYALWAYNSGWHAQGEVAGVYGLGWANNVANEDLPADRQGFLDDSYDDAKYPGHWAYPERVLGWAKHPLLRLDWKAGTYSPAYRPALWPASGVPQRPPLGTFCSTAVQCDMTQIHKPSQYPNDSGSHCLRDDLRCWWHSSVSWTTCSTACGGDNANYTPGTPEPVLAASKVLYRPDCGGAAELPAGSLIIDDVPGDVTTYRGCNKDWTNHGSLTFKFAADSQGHYPSKIDFHQVDGGFGGHMWSAHAWNGRNSANAKHLVTGTWTLDRQLNGWARVLVYVPDHRARTPQAFYTVNGSDSTSKTRSIVEGNYLDNGRNPAPGQWQSLGAFNFNGTPSVSLDNFTHAEVDGSWDNNEGVRDVPWDAIAFQPLPGKPVDQVVALGDSYASGEGAGGTPVNGVWNYYRSSDHDGRDNQGDDHRLRDACHRSPSAWARQAVLPSTPNRTVGSRADSLDPTLEYHMSACSGATTTNLLPGGSGQYQEGQQPDQGYLDNNTSLVTFSIGGNDAKFTALFEQCALSWASTLPCPDQTMDGDTAPLSAAEPARIDRIGTDLRRVIDVVRSKAPNAKILVMGYPILFEHDGQCVPGIDVKTEGPWLVAMNNRLDDTLKSSVANARAAGISVTFADPRAAFSGKVLCSNDGSTVPPQDNQQIHGVVTDLTRGDDTSLRFGDSGILSAQSFHPTNAGAATYAGVATAVIGTM